MKNPLSNFAIHKTEQYDYIHLIYQKLLKITFFGFQTYFIKRIVDYIVSTQKRLHCLSIVDVNTLGGVFIKQLYKRFPLSNITCYDSSKLTELQRSNGLTDAELLASNKDYKVNFKKDTNTYKKNVDIITYFFSLSGLNGNYDKKKLIFRLLASLKNGKNPTLNKGSLFIVDWHMPNAILFKFIKSYLYLFEVILNSLKIDTFLFTNTIRNVEKNVEFHNYFLAKHKNIEVKKVNETTKEDESYMVNIYTEYFFFRCVAITKLTIL
jgi:hypothetical protein